jgi:two-component system sensor kinase FixL
MRQSSSVRQYLDQANVIILVLGTDGEVRFINHKGCEVLECDESAILGENWFEKFVPASIRETVFTVFEGLRVGESSNVEFAENPVTTATGTEKLIAWRNTLIRNAKGQVHEILSTGEDVTVQRQTEKALVESETTLRAILETCVDGIITIDEDGRILTFNPAAVRIFGYAPVEIIGQAVNLLMPDPYRGHHPAYIDHFLRTQETRIIGRGREVVGCRKDGSTFPLYLAVSDFTVHGRKMFTGVVRDLTEFKKLQDEIIQAQKLAAIGEMAASVAHEIKNPLAGISGAIEILKDTLDAEDPRRQVMDDILTEVRRLDNTVRDLLAFSRPWNPDFQACHLHEIVERVARAYQEQENLSHLKITFGTSPQKQARVDPWLFEKVLWNVLDNAKDAMGEKGEIRFDFAESRGFVELSIKDSGDGVPEELLRDVFRPFFTTKNRGTGLGLAICKKILDAHGGSISLSSIRNHGTTVTVRVPEVSQRRELEGSRPFTSRNPN